MITPKEILTLSNRFVKLCYTNSNGAGILFTCLEDNTILLLLRSNNVTEPGTWGLPGGGLKPDETFKKAAIRETIEEIGVLPSQGTIIDTIRNIKNNWEYRIYVIGISLSEKRSWTKYIKLNNEHTMYKWFKVDNLPKNLHLAIRMIL